MIRASQLKSRFLDVFACFTLIEMGDHNPFPLIIKNVPPLIMKIVRARKIFIISGDSYGRAAFKFN